MLRSHTSAMQEDAASRGAGIIDKEPDDDEADADDTAPTAEPDQE